MSTEPSSTVAFLGIGLLGAGFVRALRRRGVAVRVWNRTAKKAQALVADGALAFDDPAEAVRGASRVHLALSDDAAVDDVLDRARAGLAPGVTIVDHTTTSAAGARARVARWSERGCSFVHAPVFMGPKNALDATGFMLVSGDPALVDRLTPELALMTGKVLPFGPEPDRAATFKLLGNLWLLFMVAGVADLFTLARALSVTPAEAAALFDAFNPGPSLPGRAKKMAAGEFSPPSWELAMARKDARLMIEACRTAGEQLAALPAIAALMDRHLAVGEGSDDWTIIGQPLPTAAAPAPIDIYGSQVSSAGRCLWMLEEVGVPYRRLNASSTDEGARAAFLAENPGGKGPYMIDGDVRLFESMAINAYLAAKYAPHLLPTDLGQRALVDQWSYWAITNLQPEALKVLLHTHFLPPEQRDAAQAEAGAKGCVRYLAQLEAALVGEHLVGSSFTLADINAGSVANLALRSGVKAGPRVTAWVEALRARPAYQRALG